MSFFPRPVLGLCVFAAISTSLYAVDGVVLIDQPHALAGNITPGDAPGFPITISQPGSYRLSGNLIVPDASTDAIDITVDSVTIDLNGFSISGPVVCSGSPVVTCSPNGLSTFSAGVHSFALRTKVFNGSIHGFGFGVEATAAGSIVERVTADSNANEGIVVNGIALEDTASMNGSSGIAGFVIRDCVSTLNRGFGIEALDATGAVVTGNFANGNNEGGIFANNATITGNTANQNIGNGISVGGGTVSGNTTDQNQGAGIQVECPTSVISNTSLQNGGTPFDIHTNGCLVVNNLFQ